MLLLDEPTSLLDIGYQQQVLELVDDLRRSRGVTVVATLHDLTQAGQCRPPGAARRRAGGSSQPAGRGPHRGPDRPGLRRPGHGDPRARRPPGRHAGAPAARRPGLSSALNPAHAVYVWETNGNMAVMRAKRAQRTLRLWRTFSMATGLPEAWDEMFAAPGKPRAPYAALVSVLQPMDPGRAAVPRRPAGAGVHRPRGHLRLRGRGTALPARPDPAGHRRGGVGSGVPRACGSGSWRSRPSWPTSTAPGAPSTTGWCPGGWSTPRRASAGR